MPKQGINTAQVKILVCLGYIIAKDPASSHNLSELIEHLEEERERGLKGCGRKSGEKFYQTFNFNSVLMCLKTLKTVQKACIYIPLMSHLFILKCL